MKKTICLGMILALLASGAVWAQYTPHQIQSGTFQFNTWNRPAVTPDGRWAFVANPDHNQIVRLDLQSMTADALAAGTHPACVTLSRDGSLLAATNYGTIQYPGDNVTLYRLTLAGATQLPTFEANANFDYYNNVVITPDNRYAFVASRYNGYLYAFDPWTGTLVESGYLGTMPTVCGLSPDGRWLAVLCRQNSFLNLKVLNLADFYRNENFVVQYDILTGSLGQDATNLDFSPDGREVYVPAYSQNRLLAYSLVDGSALPYFQTGSGPVSVTVDADHEKIFVVNTTGNSVTFVDQSAGTVTQRSYSGVTFDQDNAVVTVPGSHAAFVASRLGNKLLQFDPRTGDAVQTFSTPNGPARVAIDREGAVVVAVCEQADQLYVLTQNRRAGINRVESDGQSNIGFSFVNPLPLQNYPLTLTPYTDAGVPAAGKNISLLGGTQFVREWNSPDLGLPVPFAGWAQGTTPLYCVKGFTMFYATSLDWMDGFAFGAPPSMKLVLPYLDLAAGSLCRIHVVNPNANSATVAMQLYRNGGGVQNQTLHVTANSRSVVDGAVFQVSEPAFLVLQSDQPIWALAEFGGELTRACLPAEGLYATGRTLVLPHVAEGGGWRTQVVISNTDTNTAHLTARYYSETGVQIASTTLDVLSKRILLSDVWALFGTGQPADLRTGWIEVTGDTSRVHAGIIFSGEGDQVLSALPAQPTPQTDIYFSHVAQDSLYYTGIALVNDSGHPADVTIEIWSAAGVLVNSAAVTGLDDRSKYVRFLSDPLLGVNQQLGGYIHIHADRPLYAYSLFGITGQLLSAIPFQ